MGVNNGIKELRSVFRFDLATFYVQKVSKNLKISAEFSKNVNFVRFLKILALKIIGPLRQEYLYASHKL